MESKPNTCICGERLIEGEAEIEPIKGIKMLVPALICLNEDCEMGFVVKTEVLNSAEYWAKIGEKEYKGIIDLNKNAAN